MNSASVDFLLFSALFALLYGLLPGVRWRQAVLLLANIAFLGTFSQDLIAFLPLAAFVLAGYGGVWLMQSGRKGLFVAMIVLEIAGLIWLKKYAFLPAESLLTFGYVTLGLSYICFRMLHVLIETREGSIAKMGLLAYLNYTLGFLSLVAGPIQRYEEYAASALAERATPFPATACGSAVERIATGFFKVSVLALVFSACQERGLAQLAAAGASAPERVGAAVAIVMAYPLFLYMNFSGYMDIVIGVGRFFRLELPENFDRPFAAPNFMIFWNRWHMTLSAFFKTYVFNPLLLSLMRRFSHPRVEPFLAVFAFFFTFTLLGIWHGQTSLFVAYGVVLGFGVSANKLYQLLLVRQMGSKAYKRLSANSAYVAVCRGLTFTYFAFSLLFFWSSWNQLGGFVRALDAEALAAVWLAIFALATIGLALVGAVRERAEAISIGGTSVLGSRYARAAVTTAMIVITLMAALLMNTPAPENVYKAF